MAVSTGIILLAAGGSARLRKPKQLLLHNGTTLLQHGIQVSLDTGKKPFIVVVGANADLFLKEIGWKDVEVVVNNSWNEGISSSIRVGLKKLLEIDPGIDAVIIMVCDQPFVTVKLLEDLVKKYEENGKPIIACTYENSMGVPALFDRSIFASLFALQGDEGAKRIMKENPGWVDTIDFPFGSIDIDTDSDYAALIKHAAGSPGDEI